MLDIVYQTIEQNNLIQKGDKILLGLSGGPDSVALFHLFLEMSKKMAFEFATMHINHQLRGEESYEDEKYVVELCKMYEIECMVHSVDVLKLSKDSNKSIEETARDLRYSLFNEFLKTKSFNKIAVAHNKNDQAETILMRIIRGTGVDGLVGIRYKRDNVIRPLLDVSRSQILAYCQKNELNPRIDSSNADSNYTRNKVRNLLFPYINELFDKGFMDRLVTLGKIANNEQELVNTIVKNSFSKLVIAKSENRLVLSYELLKEKSEPEQKKILLKALEQLSYSRKDIGFIHIESAVKFIGKGKNGDEIHLPHGIKLIKSYDEIILIKDFKPTEKIEDSVLIQPDIIDKVFFGKYIIQSELIDRSILSDDYLKKSEGKWCQFFDYKSFKMGINIRYRQSGDVFKPLHGNGHKKLKEYLIDKKIPKEKRNSLLLLTSGKEIAWIVGMKLSEVYKVRSDSDVVLKVSIEKISD